MAKQLTLGEIATVESLSGQPIDAIGDAEAPKGKYLAALAFVAKKRHNPDFTFDNALDLGMDEAMSIVNEVMGDEDDDPKDDN